MKAFKFIFLIPLILNALPCLALSLSVSGGYNGNVFETSGESYYYENLAYRATLMTSRKNRVRLGVGYSTGQYIRETTIDSNVPRFINDIQGELFFNIGLDKSRRSFLHIGGIYGQFQTSDQRSFFGQKATVDQMGGSIGGGIYLINASSFRVCLEAQIGYLQLSGLTKTRRQMMTFLTLELGD
jgi:hypothetical protein